MHLEHLVALLVKFNLLLSGLLFHPLDCSLQVLKAPLLLPDLGLESSDLILPRVSFLADLFVVKVGFGAYLIHQVH